MTRIEDLVFDNGERYPILLGADGTPNYWVTLYVTEKLRQTHKQTTITNAIGHLVHLERWEDINNRNLIKEFSQLQFLSDEDIGSLSDHCMLDVKSLDKWRRSYKKSNVKFASASTASVAPIQKVSNAHVSNRIAHIAGFLYFTARTVLKNQLADKSISQSIKEMKSSLIACKPKGNAGGGLGGDPNSKAPSPEAFELILKITREDAQDNPFSSFEVRFRNALIFEVLDATGVRASEMLAIQIGDIDFHNGAISIVRRHDAVEDPRKKQPVVKTKPRKIPIDKALTERLKDYVLGVRAKTGVATKHPYLFVTHKHGECCGKPISHSSVVNRVLKPAIAVRPELLEEITRHGFRHNFNYRLSKRIDAINKAAKTNPEIEPISEKMESQIRKELNGWSSDKTAETYNLRHVREEADRVMREDMDQWSKRAKKDI